MSEDEEKRLTALLKKLSHTEEFQLWRDQVAKPLLEQWESELKKSDELPEVILRANLKHYFLIKDLMYEWFEKLIINEER